jgi:lysophospholipase L1-like esterase
VEKQICMSTKILIIFFILTTASLTAEAQGKKPLSVYKFDFGSGKAAKGYNAVSAATLYNNDLGYGFESTVGLTAVNRKGNDALRDDFISSSQPVFFSVDLPEGNYNVSLLTGDRDGASSNTVRVECRRMMVEAIKTKKGEIANTLFTVNVRDSIIRGSGAKVRLKPRERSYYHWDNKLTFEFNGDNIKLVALEITPAADVTTVFLAGNSTVVDQAEEPYAAWGQMIPSFFEPGKVAICNLAESGESLSSFISARRLEKALSMMKKGDYIFIEFGHNDQKQTGAGIGAFSSFKKDLNRFIADVRAKGGIPVMVTSMNRRNFDSTGKIVNTLGDYPQAMRQVAIEQKIPLIDLNKMSKVLYEAWGPVQSIRAFVHYPANTFPGQDKALADNTHFNPYGAYEIARCIVNGIRENVPELAIHLRKNIKAFNPASPDPLSEWQWPLSKRAAATKPDGN